MARETHRRSRVSLVPGLGQPRTIPFHGDPTIGAALDAPTAPHATHPVGSVSKKAGPARFWDTGRVRTAFTVAVVLSLVVHGVLSPWRILPPTTDIEFKDPAGDLAIPVDVLGEDTPPPPEPAPAPPPAETAAKNPDAPGAKLDAGVKAPRDAGVEPLATDGGASFSRMADAGDVAAGPVDAGAIALAAKDAGATSGSSGPSSPEAMFGMTKVVNAGTQNIVLGLNVSLIRKHPVGSRMGPVLQAIPQWREFVKGAPQPVDPIRDTDWILIYGPSLIHTDRDAVLVKYNVSDDAVDATMAAIGAGYAKGGPFDTGVPGVNAALGFADNAQRVFLRPQSKLLVIVPPSHAKEAAAIYRKQAPRGPAANEALRLVVHHPANQIAIPGLKFSQSLTELRHWIIPRADGGADVFVEGDCTDEAAANDSADALTDLLRRQNSLGVRFATRGLLNKAVVIADGPKIKLHIEVSQEQLEAILQLVAAALNATITPATAPAPAPAPRATNPQNE